MILLFFLEIRSNGFLNRKLGWDAIPGENQLDELKREQVLTALANLDHPQTKEEAINRFRAYLEDQNTSLLPVNTRKVTSDVSVSIHCLPYSPVLFERVTGCLCSSDEKYKQCR